MDEQTWRKRRRTRPEQVGRYAYLCVGVAARNRQNQLRPSSLLRPVATGRVPNTTPNTRSGSAFKNPWRRSSSRGHIADPQAPRSGPRSRRSGRRCGWRRDHTSKPVGI
jgi:hypothetical protein